MASTDPKPRRSRVPGENNSNIYVRPDGLFEVGYRDSSGKQRWRVPDFPAKFETISEARRARNKVLGMKAGGERVQPSPKLRFGEAADRWLAEQVAGLRPATRAIYTNAVENHLRPRWDRRRLDSLTVYDAARMVRELRTSGLAEWTISGIAKAAGRIFKFAQRRCGWHGENPFRCWRTASGRGSARRASGGSTGQRTCADARSRNEPWARCSGWQRRRRPRERAAWPVVEQFRSLGVDAATIRFAHQVDREVLAWR